MRAHTDDCGRTGSAAALSCEANCACWCHKGWRLEVEITEGNWQTLKQFDNLAQAQTLAGDLNNAGIPAMISCSCGSYAYGECELCAIIPDSKIADQRIESDPPMGQRGSC